jgi:hypothetical protein
MGTDVRKVDCGFSEPLLTAHNGPGVYITKYDIVASEPGKSSS